MKALPLKTYMFHYLRNSQTNSLKNLHYFDSDKFFNFVKKYKDKILTKNNIETLIHSENKTLLDRNILLTFDDGLKDHFDEAYKTLNNFGLSGIFFINSNSIMTRQMDDVHKIHFLYGSIGWQMLSNIFSQTAAEFSISLEDYYDYENAYSSYPLDNKNIALVKYAINYKLEADLKKKIIDTIFSNFSENYIQSSFYLSKEEIAEMDRNDMVFGYHGHEHIPFASLNKVEQLLFLLEIYFVYVSLQTNNIFFISALFIIVKAENNPYIKPEQP